MPNELKTAPSLPPAVSAWIDRIQASLEKRTQITPEDVAHLHEAMTDDESPPPRSFCRRQVKRCILYVGAGLLCALLGAAVALVLTGEPEDGVPQDSARFMPPSELARQRLASKKSASETLTTPEPSTAADEREATKETEETEELDADYSRLAPSRRPKAKAAVAPNPSPEARVPAESVVAPEELDANAASDADYSRLPPSRRAAAKRAAKPHAEAPPAALRSGTCAMTTMADLTRCIEYMNEAQP